MSSAFDAIDKATRIDGSHGWIQWKGTSVCMDVHCVCGAHMHVDAEFAYYLRCPHCQRVYGVGAYVRLVELTKPEHIAQATHNCLVDMEPDSAIPAKSESSSPAHTPTDSR